MGDIYYLGVKNGVGSRGELIFPDQNQSFYAGSGSSKLHHAPDGAHDIGKREWGEAAVSNGKAKYKYRITGVTKTGDKAKPGQSWDPNKGKNGTMRDSLLIHPDGGPAGTAGCIGVRGTPTAWGPSSSAADGPDVTAAEQVDGLLSSGRYERVIIKNFDTVEEMEAFHKKIAPDTPVKRPDEKRPDPPPKKAAPKKSKGGKPSKTNKQAELIKGEPTVLAGQDKLQVAYVGTPHTGGGKVVQGSKTVFVGEQRRAMARVQDPTDDGHKVSTGEQTVETG